MERIVSIWCSEHLQIDESEVTDDKLYLGVQDLFYIAKLHIHKLQARSVAPYCCQGLAEPAQYLGDFANILQESLTRRHQEANDIVCAT